MVGQLVACGDAMYLFGGNDIDENGDETPSSDLLSFVPKYKQNGGSVVSIVCTRVEAGEAAVPRFHI